MHSKILFVCLGNICRSPLAEAIFKEQIRQRGIFHKYTVDSCGTSGLHAGERPDARTLRNARHHQIEIEHIGRQFQSEDLTRFDLILPMDRTNFQNVQEMAKKVHGKKAEIQMIRNFDPEALGQQDVPDPWYGNEEGFEEVFQMLWRTCESLIDYLEKQPSMIEPSPVSKAKPSPSSSF